MDKEPEDQRFERAIARIDSIHAEDPNRDVVDGVAQPKELVYTRHMTEMLDRLAPGAPEAVRLAVRCQHIRRWEIPRTSYSPTPAGYKEWRARLLVLHAEVASGILREAGYDESMVSRVAKLLRKEGIKRDTEVQLLEDVAALVFLEHYLADFARQHEGYDEAKLLDILGKTLRKMSPEGRWAAQDLIRAPVEVAPLLEKAVNREM
ncbi:MAG: DUF4202 domain-containing protein [Betaproteobacteria bacterium]|nr:DUF4202 domain-containing protein [Betaproteobacteria bacterium]MDH3435549.1 DUF4202 domain-containing protein [Betaproteobacteria bacterium]